MKFKDFFDVIILAGGESKRFGSDKCCFEFNGKTFLERIVENFNNPIIVTNKQRKVQGIQIIDNIRKGPVKAIELALSCVFREKVFITGCDFPFITYELASFICNKEADISLIVEEEIQPLLGCYSTSFLKNYITHVKTLYQLINYANTVYFIGTYELKLHGFSSIQLKNINSWKDFLINQDKYTLSKYVIKGNKSASTLCANTRRSSN
ncbi:molybdenum cofactor guanylyltransferase [Sulfurisphaera javensis]|uniref:Molybdenum cofactor guanylyltransferase n=1 Tax=Sulfurisphaera javensis TaxID=2049879 RepID=A0AAT9GNT4_9CREN